MSAKGMNHFVFFPDKRSTWREKFVKRTENEVTNLRKTCADKHVDLACGIVLDAAVKLMSANDLNLLVAKISFLVKLGINHIALFLNQVMPGGEDQSGADFAAEQVCRGGKKRENGEVEILSTSANCNFFLIFRLSSLM
jgi:hypothetical protein